MAEVLIPIGTRVLVRDKDVIGIVSFVGTTDFAPGKWIGLTLDDPKGKNDGSVQGRVYFECQDKHGMFVRPNHVTILDDETGSGRESGNASPSPGNSPSKDKSPLQESKLGLMASARKGGIPTPSAIPKSRLPTPGTGPTSGRSPSFTNLKTKDRRESTTPHQTGLQRERSFVERNFVETLKQPQVQVQQPAPMTPQPSQTVSKLAQQASTSSPSLAAQAHSDRIEEKMANIQAQQELVRSREEIQDLKEKLETIKIKRAKDQEKIKEFEKVRIQHDQLVEFKSRIMEAHAALQKELAKAKHDAREAIEAKEQHAEEMVELSETVEMATLDKEMAEERAENLQLELEAAKEKLEELQLDLDIIKAEMGDEGSGDRTTPNTTNFEMKQLSAQNEKLRETLIKMRDLSAHEKSEIMRLTKDLEEKQTENTDLSKMNEKLKAHNEILETTISDLQEQVDAALGAEEMVENLTTKCLDLEDQYTALLEEKQDLEALHEMNEELQENAREMELELREELDLVQAKVRETERARNTAYEIIADHEATIQKFRGLVNQVQEQNQSLRDALEKETNKPVAASSAAAEMIDFKKMFAETKAHSRAIDMELRQCEVEESRRHVKLLSSFMSENFTARGSDNEAILVLLLVPRMMWKISILVTQVKEKFVSSDQVIERSSMLKGPSSSSVVERHTFGQSLLHNLNCLNATLQQFETALATCDPQLLLLMGTLYGDMSMHEKSIDFYIELLRKDQLDENVPLDNVEKSLHFFQEIYPKHLGNEKIDHAKLLNNNLKVYSSASDCLTVGVNIAKAMSHSVELYEGEIGSLFKMTENDVTELRQILKAIKRRLPHQQLLADHRPSTEPVVVFPMTAAKDLIDISKSVSHLCKAFHLFSRSCIQHALILGENEAGIPSAKLSEFLHHSLDQAFVDTETGTSDVGTDLIKSTMSQMLQKLNAFNKSLQDGEFDMDPAAAVALWNTVPPIVSRAEAYKAELKDAETLKYKLENKEMDIRDLKKAIKAKSDELSEMQIRKDKAEKRLTDATRDGDLVREKLQRKLDDAQNMLRRKEKEFEETLDHLQTELDSLESERGELRNKLKETAKKALLEGITSRVGILSPSGASSLGGSGAMSLGPSVPNPVKDSPLLLQHVQELQMAVMSLKEDSYRKQGEDLKSRLAKLKPLSAPKRLIRCSGDASLSTPEMSEKRDISKEETPSLDDVSKRVSQLRQKIGEALVSQDVVELSSTNKHRTNVDTTCAVDHNNMCVGQILRDKKFEMESERLRMEVVRLIASRKPGGQIDSDFCRFPSPGMCRAMAETDYTVVGRVRIPGIENDQIQNKKVPLLIGPKDLQMIHKQVFC